MVKTRILITTFVVWLIFSIEAFIHYSMGKGRFEWPGTQEVGKILGLVFVFSLLSATVSQVLIQTTQPPAKKGRVLKKLESKYDKVTKK